MINFINKKHALCFSTILVMFCCSFIIYYPKQLVKENNMINQNGEVKLTKVLLGSMKRYDKKRRLENISETGLIIQKPQFRHNYEQKGAYLNHNACEYNKGCDLPIAFHSMTNHGLGSDLHVWAAAKCWSILNNYSLVLVSGKHSLKCTENDTKCSIAYSSNWIWEDRKLHGCDNRFPMSCYFPHVNRCHKPGMVGPKAAWKSIKNCDITQGCPPEAKSLCGVGYLNQIQYLFSSLNPYLLDYARGALFDMFGPNGAPDKMITLHIRWGDKWKEHELVPIEDYLEAVETHVIRHSISDDEVNIFLTTEDNAAIKEFKNITKRHHPHWRVYIYMKAVQLFDRDSSATKTRTSPTKAAKFSAGGAGKESMVALLIALESEFIVTTQSSNWGRLIEELHEWVWSWPNKDNSLKKVTIESRRISLAGDNLTESILNYADYSNILSLSATNASCKL